MSIQPKTETNNAASRVWEVEVVQTSYQRDPAVRVRQSMMPAPEVLLGCCGGGRPRAPLAGGKETDHESMWNSKAKVGSHLWSRPS